MSNSKFKIEKVSEPSEAVYKIDIQGVTFNFKESDLKELYSLIYKNIYINEVRPYISLWGDIKLNTEDQNHTSEFGKVN